MGPISSTQTSSQTASTTTTGIVRYSPPQQQEQDSRIQTIRQQLQLFTIAEGPATLATLPFELLTIVTDQLPNDALLRLAPTSHAFSKSVLLSYQKREKTLFRSYMEALIHAIQQEKSLSQQTIQELHDGLSQWTKTIENEIAKAPHIATIQKTIATSRTYLAKTLSYGLVHLTKKVYLAPKPPLFSDMEKLTNAYQKLTEIQQGGPEKLLQNIAVVADLFQTFFQTQETLEALRLARLLLPHPTEFDLKILPLLIRQCFEKGMLYQALCFANTITLPSIRKDILPLIAQIIKTRQFAYKHLIKIVQSQIEQSTTKEAQIQNTLLLAQVHFYKDLVHLAHSILCQLHQESKDSKDIQEIFARLPLLNLQRNMVLVGLSTQHKSTLHFSEAIECALMADVEYKTEICDRIFPLLVQHDRLDLALPLIEHFPDELKEKQLLLLVDHQLSFGRPDQAMSILSPHIEKPWAESRCRELVERLIYTENWQEVIRIIELIPFLPLQFVCLQPLLAKLLAERNLPTVQALIQGARRPETRDILIKPALLLASQEKNFDLFKQLQGAISDPTIRESCQSTLVIQLAEEGEIEQSLEEAEKFTMPMYQIPTFFSLMLAILSSDHLHMDYSLKTILKLASRATFDNILKALYKRKLTTGQPIDIFQEDIKIFIEKLEAILTCTQKAQGITQDVQEGLHLLEQAKGIQDQFPETPWE